MEYVVVGDVWDYYGRGVADELNAVFLPVGTTSYKAREIKRTLIFDEFLNKVEKEDLGSKKFLVVLRDDRFEGDSNRYLMANCLTVNCIKELKSEQNIDVQGVDVIMPYMYYARQDERFKSEESFSLKEIADWISSWDIDRLLTYHSHLVGRENKNLQMYFDIDVHDINLAPLFADHLKSEHDVKEPVIINPDGDSKERMELLIEQFEHSTFGYVLQERDRNTGKKKVVESNLPVKGKTAVIFDDLTDTGGTLIRAFEKVDLYKPERVFIAAANMFDKEPVRRLAKLAENSPSIEAIITSDSFVSNYNTEMGEYFINRMDELTTTRFGADYIKSL